MITNYPLTWPEGFKRNRISGIAKFKKVSISIAVEAILHELKLMGVSRNSVIISTNLKLKNDGLPYSNQKQPVDRGVAVWFEMRKQQTVLACDKWNSIEDNLWSIAKTIDAMRSIDRWGVSDMLNRMFTGFVALPENTGWRQVLNISLDSTFNDIKKSYHQLVRENHPDFGGNTEKMAELNNAYEQAKREFGII